MYIYIYTYGTLSAPRIQSFLLLFEPFLFVFFWVYTIHWQHMSTRTLRNGVLPTDLLTPGLCYVWDIAYATRPQGFFSLMLSNCFAIHQALCDLPTPTCLHKSLRMPTPHRESPTQPYWNSIFTQFPS